MKMTKKFFAIVMTMMLVFTSLPMLSFGAVKLIGDPNENLPYAPEVKAPIAPPKKVKKSKKYSLTIILKSMTSCTGYRLYKVDKNGGEKKVKDFTYKSVKKAKKKIVYKDKKSKVVLKDKDNEKFVLKAYNTFYKYKKGKKIGWVKTKPSKKYWYKKGADKGVCTVESVEQKKQSTPPPTTTPTEGGTTDSGNTGGSAGSAGGGGSDGGGDGGSAGGGSGNPVINPDGEVTNPPVATCTAPTIATNLTYTGSALNLLSNPGTPSGGTLMYYVTTDSGNTPPADNQFGSTYTKTDAGTYYVWYYVKADSSHSNSEKNKLGPIEIKKATSTVTTAPTLKENLTYTGNDIDLLSNKGSATGGTLKYCVTKSGTATPANDDFGSTYKAKAVGTYYVWYYVAGDKNHKDSQKVKLGPIKINKPAIEEDGPDYQGPWL